MGSLDMSQNQNGISSCFSSQNFCFTIGPLDSAIIRFAVYLHCVGDVRGGAGVGPARDLVAPLRDGVLARGRLPRRDPGGRVHVVPEVVQADLEQTSFF